jgi:hypothetical protein
MMSGVLLAHRLSSEVDSLGAKPSITAEDQIRLRKQLLGHLIGQVSLMKC